MKIYKTQSEVEKDIKNGVLKIDDDVTFECSISINASIYAGNINAGDIDANDIKAGDIDAYNIDADNINAYNIDAYNINANEINAYNIDADNINAYNIDAYNINAYNIDAYNINANEINAYNIDADNINAGDIDANDIKADNINANRISYYAFCSVYNSIKCSSIKARRENHSEPICLDGKLEIKEIEEKKKVGKLLDLAIKNCEQDGDRYTLELLEQLREII